MPRIKRIPVHRLRLDPLNPRREKPTEELIDSIKKTGLAVPIIVHKKGKHYLVTGGWQRRQALEKAGIAFAKCEIHPDGLSALKECERTSIQRELTQYQKMKQYVGIYSLLMEEQGKTHKKAIRWISKNTSISELWANRYINVATGLPPLVLALLKEKKNITRKEWAGLKLICYTVRQKMHVLGFRKAQTLLKLPHLSDEDRVKLAIEMMSLNTRESNDLVDYVLANTEIPVEQAIKELKQGKDVYVVYVGSLIVSKEVKVKTEKHCAKRRMGICDFLERYLESRFGENESEELSV